MAVEFLFKGVLVGFFASIPLGPVGVLCVQRTINKGRSSGFISGIGASTVDSLYALIAVLGLSYIIQFIQERQDSFQVVGAIILIILGMRIFNTNPVRQIRKQKRRKNNLFEDYFSVLLLTLSNPLAILLFVAAFAGIGFITPKGSLVNSWLAIGGVFIGASVWWFSLSSLVNLFRRKFRLKQLWWMNKIAGSLIFGFGLVAITAVLLKLYH